MQEQVERVRREFAESLSRLKSASDVESVRIEYLGRSKGKVKDLMDGLSALPKEQKPAFGQAVNALKQEISRDLDAAGERLAKAAPAVGQRGDVTLPGVRPKVGRLHPVTQARNEMVEIFARLGFSVAEGPEIEDEWHNFVALNIPPEHPARDPLDNYYIRDNVLLRTQTSTVQIGRAHV